MKKRLFRNLLMLCLLLITLTVAVSAVKYGGTFHPGPKSSPNNVDWDASPSEYIDLNATVSSTNTSCNVCSELSRIITLTNVQYPVSDNYHKLALTVNLPEYACSTCGRKTGPFNNLTVTFTVSDLYFCHSYNYEDKHGNRYMQLTSSVTTEDNVNINFNISAIPRKNNKNTGLMKIPQTEATCTKDGILRDCWYCDFCKQYFATSDGNGAPINVEIPALGHKFDKITGICSRCNHKATASLNDEFKESLAAAVADYNSENGGTLRAFITPEGNDPYTLKKSGKLIVTEGVTIPKIILEDTPTVTIENSGTIDSIEMGTAGTLTIDNKGVASIKTPVTISGGTTRTINVTNHSSSTIHTIEAPNTLLTVQNDGTIGELIGYFHTTENDSVQRESMVTLQCGAGIYQKITSWRFNSSSRDSADFSKLLSDGVYFYFEDGKIWRDSADFKIKEIVDLQNVYCTGHPIASIGVTGTADGSPVELTKNGNSFSMTVTAGQDITLTGVIGFPTQGLRSDEEHISYRWTGAAGNGKSAELKSILFGEYNLTLTVADDRYNHSQKVNIHITAQQGEQKTPLFLKKPTLPESGFFKKQYDGTDDAIYNLRSITFYTTGEREITVDSQYYDFTVRYPSPNCTNDKTVDITATVWLTDDGKEHFTLGTDGTASFTVPGKITQVSAAYKILPQAARVGDHIFSCFMLETNFYKDGYQYPGSLNPGADMKVDGEALPVTFYRLHPSNIINNEKADDLTAGSDFVSDPEIDEPLTKDSVFKYAGKYYIYAIVKPTTNYVGKITNCRVINVQETEASAKHHEGYTAWDGMTTVPIKAGEEKSVYLSGSLPTIYTELLLGLKKNLTLCLNGKTLSATNSTTSFDQIRVTGGAKLTIDDCAGTGTAKGTVVSSGVGGIAYVQNGSITINGGKFTGGTAKTGGGAIVVDEGGELNIIGGEISGNTVTDGDGGAIYIKSGGIVNIHGGKITGNHVTSGNGGAIYVAAGGTLNLYGGEISDNTASGLGGGIYVEKGGELHIQNAPVVMDNTANGKASNVYLAGNDQQLSAVNMTAGAKIGISVEASLYPARFALSPTDTSAYFIPDTEGLSVMYLTAGGLSLVAKPSAKLDGKMLTVETGGYPDDAVLFVAEYDDSGRMTAVHVQNVTSGQPSYTFTVSSSNIKCFLLRKDTYTPLLEAFSPDSN